MILETLFSGVFGGLLRLAPEAMKLFDRANERKHELAMLDREMELQKLNASSRAYEVKASVTEKEIDAISEAFKEQSKTAIAAGSFVAALSALVRPMTTYIFVSAYVAVKVASYLIAVDQGGEWKDVLVSLWNQDDVGILFMILSFWFVGRVLDRK